MVYGEEQIRRGLPGGRANGAQWGTETAPSRRVTKDFERQRSCVEKLLFQNEEVEKRSCSPMRSGAVSDGPGHFLGSRGSQAEHKPTRHHDTRAKLATSRLEGEERKPQLKQAARTDCPSPTWAASALRLTKESGLEGPACRESLGKVSLKTKSPRGSSVTDFQGRKHCCQGRAVSQQ